jgi:hypothetical protein
MAAKPLREAPSLSITEVMDLIERDRPRHCISEPAGPEELDRVAAVLGVRLPSAFRELLARLGGSILYECHELFGPLRLMVNDIELVPDVVSFREHFARTWTSPLPPTLVPFHRADGVVNLLDAREGAEPAVVSQGGDRSYPDLACFLEQVVLPSRKPPRRP